MTHVGFRGDQTVIGTLGEAQNEDRISYKSFCPTFSKVAQNDKPEPAYQEYMEETYQKRSGPGFNAEPVQQQKQKRGIIIATQNFYKERSGPNYPSREK